MNKDVNIKTDLEKLFTEWAGETPNSILPLPAAGSNRKYFRITSASKCAIGVFNEDRKENQAFIEFSKVFNQLNFSVPQLYKIGKEVTNYLIQDLGNQTLFDLRQAEPHNSISKTVLDYYRKSLSELLKFQFLGIERINLNDCYPRKAMDRQSILWDLNYFKYYFLKIKNIQFDEQLLENDFHKLIDLLLEADQNYFMYRDFQSRNIMIYNNSPYFIDYQGARLGALQYDLASILYQVKAKIPDSIKEELIAYYLNKLSSYSKSAEESFLKHFYPYVFIRLIQVMGAYGFRGLIEKRTHFIESLPLAIDSLKNLISHFTFINEMPELNKCILMLARENQEIKRRSRLLLKIKSFAYKAGIPADNTSHGEGFVFDCRSLPNPGRLKKYQYLSGQDNIVANYLKEHAEVFSFLDHVYRLVDGSIDNYIERDFTNLNVNFGCTGGQHRSVFFAESLKTHIETNYQINVELTHTQKPNWITKK
ncbi:MAG: phosphotransferase [Bacteroidetes bacterium]|nr:phosphotransferase [Bacteroidota bacterium]